MTCILQADSAVWILAILVRSSPYRPSPKDYNLVTASCLKSCLPPGPGSSQSLLSHGLHDILTAGFRKQHLKKHLHGSLLIGHV